MIEILVVITLSVFLLMLGVPFMQSAQARMDMRRTVEEMKTEIQAVLNHARTGKSVAGLSTATPNAALPAYYGLYFKADETYGDPKGYLYAELSEGLDKNLTLLTLRKNKLAYPSVFLKELRLDNNQTTRTIPNAWVFLTSPGSKIYIFEGSEDLNEVARQLNATKQSEQNALHQKLEMDLQYKDDPKSLITVSFNRGKMVEVK